MSPDGATTTLTSNGQVIYLYGFGTGKTDRKTQTRTP